MSIRGAIMRPRSKEKILSEQTHLTKTIEIEVLEMNA